MLSNQNNTGPQSRPKLSPYLLPLLPFVDRMLGQQAVLLLFERTVTQLVFFRKSRKTFRLFEGPF